ncbi:efflux transporter outer membrane subunit [Glaciecola petra]|uniref:Efflux transporter outer membrane subunit n=1 Tax=Glaciecola petra TaxID=3075602 RepID=A0ABU2ZQH4_9ALTE|nr:efflux transporter outer membrane subunit [Aestuariibacter sp. P117]MDT0594885.1 efflux transporter outer membrane subunit [Aestuariibacter sp. P117]
MKFTLYILLLISLSGCTLQHGQPPASADIEANLSIQYEQNDVSIDENSEWWKKISRDEELSDLIEQLLNQSFELVSAASRIRQASARHQQVYGDLLPTLNARLSATEVELDDGATSNSSDNFNLGFDFSWNVDVFGGLRSASEAQRLSFLSQIAAEKSLRQSLIVNLTNLYIQGWAVKEELHITQSLANSFENTLALTEERFRNGVEGTDATDVALAKQNLADALAGIPSLKAQLKTISYSINVLVGNSPSRKIYRFDALISAKNLTDMPTTVPSQILILRPDVYESRLAYEAARADVRAANADLFPTFSFSASIDDSSKDLSSVIDLDAWVASFVGNILAPIYAGEKLRAAKTIAEEKARELSATYATTILNAVLDVEKAIVDEQALIEQLTLSKASLDAAHVSDLLGRKRYTSGQQSLLTILETSRALNNAKLSYLNIQRSRIEARVALFLALGGVWTNTPIDEIPVQRRMNN